MTKRRLILLAIIALAVMMCVPAGAGQAPKNIILMIGDGMGFGQVTLARLSLDESSAPLSMDSMRYTAFVKTHSADATVTDSAAAASACATGFKTNNGMISTLPDGTPADTILEIAKILGKSTGLVTTTAITHATPAAFGAHVKSRKSEADIAGQLLANRIDVLLGGGRMFFVPKSQEQSKREDERDLLAEAKSFGYAVVDSRDGMLSVKGTKLLGLFEMGALSISSAQPSLAEMTARGIEILSKDDEGFFLMVEGGQIDWACHRSDGPGTVKQMFDFDAAIGKALDFARKHADTLVVVTGDHETGALAIVYPDKDSNARFKINWGTTGHSGTNLPLFADGPGAHLFTGVLDNTDVPKKFAELWGIKGFGSSPQ